MRENTTISILLLLIKLIFVLASNGDRSPYYQNCVRRCLATNCTQDGQFYTKDAAEQLDLWSRLLWGCRDECRYNCMWSTVHGFQERGYGVPKFHGKWPFARILGVQEPASALASLLNLAAHIYMWTKMSSQFSAKSTPLVLFWHCFVAVCVNAWTWSFIFHTRDTPFTEFMDYACALSMVIALFIASIVRVFHKRRKLSGIILMVTLVYYIQHVMYLHSGNVDYDYNMLVNVVFGAAGCVTWVSWATVQYLSGSRYSWRVVAFSLLSAATLALELGDWPPRRGWDAHATWHLATSPLPLLFYRFVIDDLHHLRSDGFIDFTYTIKSK